MKVEIWSDIACPFCYIGKRRFEKALSQFEYKENIQVEWKSFVLNPDLETNPKLNSQEHLAQSKGWTKEYTEEVSGQVTAMAAEEGLQFDFTKTVVANTLNAHKLIQFAKTKGKGDGFKERLLKAYFTEGKNVDDTVILAELAGELNLELPNSLSVLLNSDSSDELLKNDLYEAHQLGIRGVPFFLINDKYTISGAQSIETFLGALQQAWSELAVPNTANNACCAPGDNCA